MAKKAERTPTYGLKWRGFIASLMSDKVRENLLEVLEKNPQLELPVPREVLLPVIVRKFTDEELRNMAYGLFKGFLKSIPLDLELLKEEEYGAYIIPTLMNAKDAIPEKDWSQLMEIPEFRNFAISEILKQERELEKALEGIRLLKQKLGL